MSQLLQRYLKPYAGCDDIDSIAEAMRDALEGRAKATVEGVLAMLEHPARLEIDAFDTMVAYPPLLERVAERGTAALAKLADRLVPRLRKLTSADEPGVRQRATYALVRLLGPDAPEVASGLQSRDKVIEAAVICALADLPGSTLPAALAAPIDALLARGRDEADGDARFFERPLVRAALRLPDPGPRVLRVLEDAALRPYLDEALGASRGELTDARAALAERFELAASRIEAPGEGRLADRNELDIAARIARIELVQRAIASRAAAVFDAVVAVARATGYVKHQSPHETLDALAQAITPSLSALPLELTRALAAHLPRDYAPLFDVAAHAWLALPADEARALAEGFSAGAAELARQRWDAAATAFASAASPPAAHAELLARQAGAHNLTPALRAALAHAPVDGAKIDEMVRKARNAAELSAALEVAAEHGYTAILRAALEKLRGGPFRVDAALEGLIARLIDDDNDIWIEAEIDGENPFRDRREALARARASRR